MKLFDAFRINSKKLKFRTSKAAFLIIPVAILVSLSFIVSSQVKNIQDAIDTNVFAEIEEENTVLELVYPREDFQGGPQMMTEAEYSEADLQTILSIQNVKNASINYDIPITNITTTDLFDGTEVSLRNLSALDTDMAGIYTNEDFSYQEGETIPIILNASQFTRTYEDWNGEDEYVVDFEEMRQSERPEPGSLERPEMPTPIKSKAISYSKDDLLGKEFTITFGGFDEVADYEIERDMGTMTFVKLSDSEIEEAETEKADTIGGYWDYNKLAEGVTYTFKVVAVIESETSNSIYIPEEFSSKLMSDYINLQLDSVVEDVPEDELNSTFTGLLYDGTELNTQDAFAMGGRGGPMMGIGRPGEETDESSQSYEIPGLIIEVDEDNTSEVVGIYSDTSVFDDAIKSGEIINIKVDDISNRSQVIEDLNGAGYAYQDISDLDVFANVEKTLNKVSTGVVIGFIILTVAIIILTMSKFVSESKKEIGIFRAVGFTKGNILTIFLTQSMLYTFVGYLAGFALGVLGIFATSHFIGGWFEDFVNETVKESLYVVSDIDYSIFSGIDFGAIGILSVILAVITIVISFLPAYKASMVSPVEAIKSE